MPYYSNLLKLCGFDDEEIDKEKLRIEKAFKRLSLGPEDIAEGEVWVKQNHDTELMGVRKLLGAWLKELIDLVLSRDEGKKIVYYGFPSIQGPGSAIAAASKDVYCSCPDVILCHTLGQIFNKLNPVLEAAEENGLPPGYGLCSLQQIRVGGMAKGIIPVPDMVMTSSYYCDMGSKTDELLHMKYGHPAVYVDGSMDSNWGEYPEYSKNRVEYLGAQLNKLFQKVSELIDVEVTRENWDSAMSLNRQLYSQIGRLTKLMKADPLPVSQAEIGLATWLSSGSTRRASTEGPTAIGVLIKEIEEKIEKGIGIVEKGAPRVATLIHNYSDPSITRMIENTGLAYGATVFSSPPPKAKSNVNYPTLGEMIADREMRLGVFHSSFGLAQRCVMAVEELELDGLIWNYLFNCRPLSLPSHFLKNWVEKTTGVPTLALETDNYETRTYSADVLRSRVEAFSEMLRARKK